MAVLREPASRLRRKGTVGHRKQVLNERLRDWCRKTGGGTRCYMHEMTRRRMNRVRFVENEERS